MIELRAQRAERGFDIEKINDETRIRIRRAFKLKLDAVRMPVHPVAAMRCWDFRQTVRSLKGESLGNSHRIPITL